MSTTVPSTLLFVSIVGAAMTIPGGGSLSWFTACLGLMVSDPESAQAIGLEILFPVAFVSSCFVPTQGLPTGCG